MQPISSAEVIARWDSLVERGQYKRANTLEALVDALGLPREKTLQTISRYNELCDKKADTDFYKRPDELIAIKTAPFYGAVSGEAGLLCVLGGLRTNACMQVCDESDNPIPGLYNIGTVVGDFYAGLYTFQMEGINYGATCITFGYPAGKYIAANE
jgi:succinate dehydrogenase/fumarate reductase flavoprotein subunit